MAKRIQEVGRLGQKATRTYAVKKDTGKFGANVHRYDQEMIRQIQKELKEELYFFGYTNSPNEESKNNPTAFFTFENHSEADA